MTDIRRTCAASVYAHVRMDEPTRTIRYEYNGRTIVTIRVDGDAPVNFRGGSDGVIDCPTLFGSVLPDGSPTSTVCTFPIRPLRTSSHATRKLSCDRCQLPVCQIRPYRWTASTMAFPSANVCENGFSP